MSSKEKWIYIIDVSRGWIFFFFDTNMGKAVCGTPYQIIRSTVDKRN